MLKLFLFLSFFVFAGVASAEEDIPSADSDIFSLYKDDIYSGGIKVTFKSSGTDFVEYRDCGSSLPFILADYVEYNEYSHYRTKLGTSYPKYSFRLDYLEVSGIASKEIEVLQFCRFEYKEKYLDSRWNIDKIS